MIAGDDRGNLLDVNGQQPAPWLTIVKPGWIQYGDSRVFVQEALGGFFALKDLLLQELGPEQASEICFKAGVAASERLMSTSTRNAFFDANESGLRQALSLLTMAGYGTFEIDEIDLAIRRVQIRSYDGVEGWVYQQVEGRFGANCDFTRGMLCGLVRSVLVRSDPAKPRVGEQYQPDMVSCIETGCISAADDCCTFVVGPIAEVFAEGLRPHNLSHVSVRETLLRLNRQFEQIMDASWRDPLTKLYNRSFFESALRQRIGFAKRASDLIALAAIDIDYFKRVNDSYGHMAGDLALRRLASELLSQARENDVVCRLGGDEFVWLMPGTGPDIAAAAAHRIRSSIQQLHLDLGFVFTVSIGIAGFPRDSSNAADLMAAADRALYRAKELGRNQVLMASSDLVPNIMPQQPLVQFAATDKVAPTDPQLSFPTAAGQKRVPRVVKSGSARRLGTGIRYSPTNAAKGTTRKP